MSRIKAPSELPDLVKTAFANARQNGDLHYFPTQVTILNANSIPFQLRFSPALANKPKGPPPDPTQPRKPFDPFENPPAALRITDVGPSHFLVLNKFAIVPEHFILATREFKQQTHVLEEDDLEATLACIQAYEDQSVKVDKAKDGKGGLYAFFNSGDHSGASQPHRHIQLLPIARMRDGLEGEGQWDVLADQLDKHRAPFTTFCEKIRLGMPSKDLHAAYLRLYQRAYKAVAHHTQADTKVEDVPTQGESLMSYNMAMTKDTLVLSPRMAEGAEILAPDGKSLGSLALNGTVLAGTALVKNEVEWKALEKDEGALLKVLRGIGVPSEEVDESQEKL